MLVCDRSIEKRFDDLIKEHCNRQKETKQSASVALLVGRRTENEDLVLSIPSCPLPDSVTNAEDAAQGADPKKGRTPRPAADCVDAEWVAQQVHQVLRMLPGGLSVIGLVLIGEKLALRDLHSTMLKSLKLMWKSESRMQCGATVPERMRLVNLEAPLGKPAGVTVENFSTSLPRTFSSKISFQSLSWIPLQAQIAVSELFPVHEKQVEKNFQQMLMNTIDPFLKRFNSSVLLVDKKLRDTSEQLIAPKKGKKGSKKEAVESVEEPIGIDILLERPERPELDQSRAPEVTSSGGWLEVKGKFSCRGVVDGKATVEDALEAMKNDIFRSVYTRVELHYEGMLVVDEEEEPVPTIHKLPRRVFLCYPENHSIWFSDYLFEGDTTADSVESFEELLQIKVQPDEVIDEFELDLSLEELETIGLKLNQTEDEPKPEAANSTSRRTSAAEIIPKAAKSPTVLYLILAVMGVIVAIIVYFLLESNPAVSDFEDA